MDGFGAKLPRMGAVVVVIGIVLTALFLTKTKDTGDRTGIETNQDEDGSLRGDTGAAEEGTAEQDTEYAAGEFSFGDLKQTEFWFASGAGGWSTTMTIEEDGTFSGVYHDSDMGSSGEGYPNGTVYYCSFQGKFTQPEQVEEYVFKTSIESLTYDYPVDTEEIRDNIRYIYMDAYGLDDPKDILIYLPGMPTDALPEGYLSWVRSGLFIDYDSTEMVETMPFYGLYNVNAEQGFSSYNIIENLKENIAFIEELAADLEDSIMNDPTLNQADLNMKSQELYEYWDSALNIVWENLKKLLDEEAMASLTEEEREWIAYKEQQVKEAGTEVEGGSMYPMITYQKAAELTKIRVYELMELLETGGQNNAGQSDTAPNSAEQNSDEQANAVQSGNYDTISDEMKSRLIKSQTFQVELEDWGEVTFASFAPAAESEDVSFYLLQGDQILYSFEWYPVEAFREVKAVSFQDVNRDNRKDVLIICNYDGIDKDGKAENYDESRIYLADPEKEGFLLDSMLNEYLGKQRISGSIGELADVWGDYLGYLAGLEGKTRVDEQLKVIAGHRDLWYVKMEYANDIAGFAITDLNHNGRLEVIYTSMGGTGSYSYSSFYEISETYDALEECRTDFVEGDSQPDIFQKQLTYFYDKDAEQWKYLVEDFLKIGAAEYHENKSFLSLKDGAVSRALLAYRNTLYTESGSSAEAYLADGSAISETEYDEIEQKYFAGQKVYTLTPGWNESNLDGMDEQDVLDELLKSYEAMK